MGRIIEYHGPGLGPLSAMDRHVIANMGAEMGATTTVFPADRVVREFLRSQGRESDFTELLPDANADYDLHDDIDLACDAGHRGSSACCSRACARRSRSIGA